MIIIKTKAGDMLVNDREIISVQHDREAHTVNIGKKTVGTLSMWSNPPVEHVESVNYINDQTGTEWKDNGSQVEQLQRELADRKTELGYCYEMNKKLEDNLRSFASEMIQIVQYHHDDIPTDICGQMRNHGEDMKKIANDRDWLYRRQWFEAHTIADATEADIADKLHTTIEKQGATIRQLTIELEHMKAQQKFNESVYDPTKDVKPSWWQRFLSRIE